MALSTGNTGKKKSGISGYLPRISTFWWLIIIAAAFLIAMTPMVMNYMNETAQQELLIARARQLQKQYDELKNTAEAQSTLPARINQLKAEAESLKLVYRNVDDNLEISQELIDLAWQYDITITNMAVNQSSNKIAETEFPVLSYTIGLSGQVANFQNFLLNLGNKFKTSQVSNIKISPAQVQGELDKATVSIDIYCAKNP
ncbi:MAG: hypothetical protein PHO26_08865 [Dehalococcoidia bacterium]|nr:hypothetical protein [Dehalococcoidia bacterium]MDD5495341.1 hypothetical protein [Dehalococcoidia bacterium]